MNITQISGCDVGGGAETVVKLHHLQLQREGHTSQLLVGRKESNDPTTVQIPFVAGPKGIQRSTRWIQRNVGLQNLYSPSFRKLENSFQSVPDVLHFHSLHGADSFAELSVVRKLSKKYPTVVSLHDLWLMTGHCGHPLDCPRWKTGCGKCPDLTIYPSIPHDVTRINHWRKRRTFRDCNFNLVVPSSWLAQQVAQSPVVGHMPVSVVPNPVDTEVFSPGDTAALKHKHGIGPTDITVMMVAQHLTSPFKGIDKGIESLNLISNPNVKVILVGHAAKDVCTQLTSPAIILPFTKRSSELANYYRMADLLLMPSQGETFGLVAAEAMACGTPVIAFEVGGLTDVIPNEEIGILIPRNDVRLMAKAVTTLLNDANRRNTIAENATTWVTTEFNLSRHTGLMLSIYESASETFKSSH